MGSAFERPQSAKSDNLPINQTDLQPSVVSLVSDYRWWWRPVRLFRPLRLSFCWLTRLANSSAVSTGFSRLDLDLAITNSSNLQRHPNEFFFSRSRICVCWFTLSPIITLKAIAEEGIFRIGSVALYFEWQNKEKTSNEPCDSTQHTKYVSSQNGLYNP